MDTNELKDCWAVILKGHEIDLKTWANQFKAPHNPVVLTMPDGETLLFSDKFHGLSTSSEIRAVALDLIPILNGIMEVEAGSQPLEFDGVSQFEGDGNQLRHRFISGSGTIRFSGSATITSSAAVTRQGPEGLLVPPPPPALTTAQRLAAQADLNPAIAKMLDQLSKADNWGEIYIAFEHAKDICGGLPKLRGLFGSNAAQFENARLTANHHRHARVDHRNPNMSIGEAKSLAREAVMLALKETKSL